MVVHQLPQQSKAYRACVVPGSTVLSAERGRRNHHRTAVDRNKVGRDITGSGFGKDIMGYASLHSPRAPVHPPCRGLRDRVELLGLQACSSAMQCDCISLGGSRDMGMNASVASLVALRGADLDRILADRPGSRAGPVRGQAPSPQSAWRRDIPPSM
jgi:hypothetical protein